MSSVTCPQSDVVRDISTSAGDQVLDTHQMADRILDLLKVAAFLALAVVLRQSISDGEVETESVVPGYQQPGDAGPGNAELLDLSTV